MPRYGVDMTQQSLTSQTDAVTLAVLEALQQAAKPLTMRQIHQAVRRTVRVSMDRVEAVIGRLRYSGRVYRFPPYRSNSPRYFHQSPHSYATELLLAHCASGPQKLTDLARKVAKPAGIGRATVQDLIRTLVAEGRLWRHPPLPGRRTVTYGVAPPNAELYFSDLIAKLRQRMDQLTDAGLQRSDVLAAFWRRVTAEYGQLPTPSPPEHGSDSGSHAATPVGLGIEPSDLEEQIITAICELDPEALRGALVPIRRLRQHPRLAQAPKASFDAALFQLARQRRVALHRHDFPAELSPEERLLMAEDPHGNVYVGVVLLGSR